MTVRLKSNHTWGSAGGVGLGEYVRHLAMIDYVVFAGTLEGELPLLLRLLLLLPAEPLWLWQVGSASRRRTSTSSSRTR